MGSTQSNLPSSSQADLEKAGKFMASTFEKMQSHSKLIIGLIYAGLSAI